MARGTTARPRDRFDDVPADLARVGAHRAPVRGRRGLVTFAWAALATGVLVGAGVFGLSVIEDDVTMAGTAGTTSSAAAAPAPTIDPAETIVVLNATTTTGLAAKAATIAEDAGWKNLSSANADSQDVQVSTVYYGRKSQQAAALGLAKSLGIGKVEQTDRFDVQGQPRLTVIVGADFVSAS